MDQTIAFRSSLFGFNREDVIDYIKHLMEENARFRERIGAFETEVKSKIAETEEIRAKLAETETKCRELENDRMDTSKIGAALVDARRFSDLLCAEAKEKASEMFVHTAEASDFSAEKALSLAEEMSKLRDRLFEMMVDAESSLSTLGGDLRSFYESVMTDNEAFMQKFADETQEKFSPDGKKD